jgi:shikimate dehydrogenase
VDALKLGLLGRKLAHSRSPAIHRFLGKALGVELSYDLFETDDPLSIFAKGLDGFNVTIPYKEALFPGLSRMDPLADRIGAVNAVRRSASGWEGFNTDYPGFISMLARAGITVEGRDFLVLGTGGAAKGCALALQDSGARSLRFASRRPGEDMVLRDARGKSVRVPVLGYAEAETMGGMTAVNATPLGMDPDEASPLSPEAIRRMSAAVDVVFNPFLTPFLRSAVSSGVPGADGLDMLAVQGARAFELWTGESAGKDLEDALCRFLRLASAKGVAIVGMPFSGKSSLLASLRKEAASSGVMTIDLDEAIEAGAGMRIPEIFASEGEEGFRARESRALEAAVASGPHIIACGGGALTREANLRALRNDAIMWLDVGKDELLARFLSSVPGSRPLLKSAGDLVASYEKRLPVYRAASRFSGDAAGIAAAAREWLSALAGKGGAA